MQKQRLLVPRKLAHVSPELFDIACKQKTQAEADAIVRIIFPDIRLASDADTREHRRTVRTTAYKHDAQMAGTYSLELCQGGGAYHKATETKRHPSGTMIAYAVTEVPEDIAQLNDYKRKSPRGQKCYLPAHDPKKKSESPLPVLEIHNDLLDV